MSGLGRGMYTRDFSLSPAKIPCCGSSSDTGPNSSWVFCYLCDRRQPIHQGKQLILDGPGQCSPFYHAGQCYMQLGVSYPLETWWRIIPPLAFLLYEASPRSNFLLFLASLTPFVFLGVSTHSSQWDTVTWAQMAPLKKYFPLGKPIPHMVGLKHWIRDFCDREEYIHCYLSVIVSDYTLLCSLSTPGYIFFQN